MRLPLESLLAALVAAGPGLALAADSAAEQCYRLPSHVEARECLLSRDKESADALVRLEKAFRAALSLWGQEPSYKARSRLNFDSAAASFRRYRTEQCEFQAALAAGGNAAGDRRLLCAIELNKQRIAQLKSAVAALK